MPPPIEMMAVLFSCDMRKSYYAESEASFHNRLNMYNARPWQTLGKKLPASHAGEVSQLARGALLSGYSSRRHSRYFSCSPPAIRWCGNTSSIKAKRCHFPRSQSTLVQERWCRWKYEGTKLLPSIRTKRERRRA